MVRFNPFVFILLSLSLLCRNFFSSISQFFFILPLSTSTTDFPDFFHLHPLISLISLFHLSPLSNSWILWLLFRGFTKLNKADFTKLRQEKRVAPTSIFSDSLFLSPTAPCLSISILAMSMVMNPLLLFRATNNYYLIISLMCGFNFGEGRRIERVKKNQRRYATGVSE